jgi:hypothetical protein
MFAERAKKQRDIVMTIIELKTLFVILVILSIVMEVPVFEPVRSWKTSDESVQANEIDYLKLVIMVESDGSIN